MDTVHSSLQYQLWPVLRCNGKSVCNTVLGHNFLHKIIFTWYWVQLFCRQWIHLIEFEGSKMSCILFCISIQMLNCSIVQQCAVQLLCRQWCLRQKCVTHHTRTRPALSFVFFCCILPFIFSHAATTVGMGRVTLKINHLISKNTRAC